MLHKKKISFIVFYIWNHQKSQEISSNILLYPKYHIVGKSWQDYRTQSHIGLSRIYKQSSKYKRSFINLNLLLRHCFILKTNELWTNIVQICSRKLESMDETIKVA